jgi:hypothetical protein
LNRNEILAVSENRFREQIELHRDRMWPRDEDLRIESAASAERFIEDVGFEK